LPMQVHARSDRAAALLLLLASFLVFVDAIYPDDHWKYSTELTVSSFDKAVKAEIDAGRTMFVRWIASSG